jgi:quercetin dioxygenase-like cupin family protein
MITSEAYPQVAVLEPRANRKSKRGLVAIDLDALTEKIRVAEAFKKSDRNAVTIFKADGLRIVLVALHRGAKMIENSAAGVISVQVLEGKITFSTDGQSVELAEGQLLALHGKISHSIKAHDETIFLLTLTTPSAEA